MSSSAPCAQNATPASPFLFPITERAVRAPPQLAEYVVGSPGGRSRRSGSAGSREGGEQASSSARRERAPAPPAPAPAPASRAAASTSGGRKEGAGNYLQLYPQGELSRHAPEGDAWEEARSLIDIIVATNPETAGRWNDVATLHTAHMQKKIDGYVPHAIGDWKRTFLKKVRGRVGGGRAGGRNT